MYKETETFGATANGKELQNSGLKTGCFGIGWKNPVTIPVHASMKRTSLLLAILIAAAAAPAWAQPATKSKNIAAKQKPEVAATDSEPGAYNDLLRSFKNPPDSAKPWAIWYWMKASVSKPGITADLQAMKEAGIGGAYLMPIQGAENPPLFKPVVEQLSPLWWDMVRHAMKEADRLGLKIGMHACDGFAVAGGPWITPELSMQKVVWSKIRVTGGSPFNDTLPKPETVAGYYRDIAVYAYPTPAEAGNSSFTIIPKITTSKSDTADLRFLLDKNNKKNFSCDSACRVQYAFDRPFTCRSIIVRNTDRDYQVHRLQVEVSDDGKTFRSLGRLQPPRAGWQNGDFDVTHVIAPVTARYFRFTYDKSGSEPGAEDLDAAKWKPSLKLLGIELSGEPLLHQYEGKNGSVWRISPRTTARQVPDSLCVPADKLVNITRYMDSTGRLNWNAPSGNWTILRMGHTSTGHTNYIGGAAVGLECDKFNPEAVRLQYDKWFGEVFRKLGADAEKVLKVFHLDSWECGSQNWSPVFIGEFRKRRGYDLLPFLPAMAGVPVGNAGISERFLYDVRQTVSELVVDNFFGTMSDLAHAQGCTFTGETVAPTMTSDGLMHFQKVDVPMGEFWLRSPSHDKPNDMLDAISGARIYGKPVVMAEAFTEVRFAWDEYPGMLKTLGDRNYALGVNRFAYHVFVHNPWMDRKPGMTLSGVGLYFQRDQTWWKPGREWVAYAQRCQALLQQGRPVADIAVFTGEEIPRRAVLPDRLVPFLPGIFGAERVKSEEARLANKGEPLRQIPDGVNVSANMADPENWVDPLRGYAYDSYNPDALLRLSKVNRGRIELPGGASYGILVVPGVQKMNPNGNLMSPEVAERLKALVEAGATVLINERPEASPGLSNHPADDEKVRKTVNGLWNSKPAPVGKTATAGLSKGQTGKGRILKGPYGAATFDALGVERDVIATDTGKKYAGNIAWTHRTAPGLDIYFISNQLDSQRTINLSLRVAGRLPELWDAVTGETRPALEWRIEKNRTLLPVRLDANGSLFVVFAQPTTKKENRSGKNWVQTMNVQTLGGPWQVSFDAKSGGPRKPVTFDSLTDWSTHTDTAIRYYSGTATYFQSFDWESYKATKDQKVWLRLGTIANIAEVTLNGVPCGVAWTPPYEVDITKALFPGQNHLKIDVTNTWANRLIGDHNLPENKQLTKTTAPYRLEGKPLLKAGLLGPVQIFVERK